MKFLTPLAVALTTLVIGCAHRGVTVSTPVPPKQPANEAAITRGKSQDWEASVTVENVQGFNESMFADLRRTVIEPLSKGPYRYAINSITLAAVPGLDREWNLLVALDNGAAIRVEDFVQWDESRQSYFSHGYKRALTGLREAGRKDEALGRYVATVSNPKKPTKAELRIAQTQAAARAQE